MSRSIIRQLWRRVQLMVGRAVLTGVNDALRMQLVQVEGLSGEVLDRVERIQNYGLTSHPHPEAEVLLVAVGGIRQFPMAVAVDDRRYRILNLQRGEVCLYTDEDGEYDDDYRDPARRLDGPKHRIHMKRGRIVEIHAGASSIVMSPAGVEITSPALTHNGTNVGDDHVHGGITAGGATTLGPQ